MSESIETQLPPKMFDEQKNRERIAEWLRRADILPNLPLSDREVFECLREIQYDATLERAERFCRQTPAMAPEVKGGQRKWQATPIVGFASWLEVRRLWLPGEIHLGKKSVFELEREHGAQIRDIDLYAVEDIIRLAMTAEEKSTLIGLLIGLEVKLGL
jgi:hypothetical protein